MILVEGPRNIAFSRPDWLIRKILRVGFGRNLSGAEMSRLMSACGVPPALGGAPSTVPGRLPAVFPLVADALKCRCCAGRGARRGGPSVRRFRTGSRPVVITGLRAVCRGDLVPAAAGADGLGVSSRSCGVLWKSHDLYRRTDFYQRAAVYNVSAVGKATTAVRTTTVYRVLLSAGAPLTAGETLSVGKTLSTGNVSPAGGTPPAAGLPLAEEALLDRALEASLEHAVPGDQIRERVLAAAAEIFGRSGIRRSSIEDVARRAGVSRITVYRRFPTKKVLVEEVLLRDLRSFFVAFRFAVKKAETASERLVEGFVFALRTAHDHPLFGGLIAAEPEVMLPFLTTDGAGFLGTVRDFIAAQLDREQEVGEIPPEVDTRIVAEVLARMTLSFFLTPESYLDLDEEEQIREFARCFLAPLVTGSGPISGDQGPGDSTTGG